MNQFIFCVVVDHQILYGTLQAKDGRAAKELLQEKFKDRKVDKMCLKGVTSKTYEFDVVDNFIV